MIAHQDLMTAEFWQDKNRIKLYCYAILAYIDKTRTVTININFSGFNAYVDKRSSSHYEITIPTINHSEDITKQLIHRSIFLRHELAHICFTDELDRGIIQRMVSYSYFNYIEDIRIEKLFSKYFNGSYTGFKTLRFVHFVERAKNTIENSKSFGNFLAFMIYRNYGFSFDTSIEMISFYEDAFIKIKNMFNVLTAENYYEIMKILKKEYALIHKSVKENKKQEEEKEEEEKITQETIKELNLDKNILEILIPDKIEENEINKDDIEFEEHSSDEESESDEIPSVEPELENETELDSEDSEESTDTDKKGKPNESEEANEVDESELSEESESDNEEKESSKEDDEDDEDETSNNAFEQKSDDVRPDDFIKTLSEISANDMYDNFYQFIIDIKNNIDFDKITNPIYFDLQEFCDVLMTRNRAMLKCDDNSHELSTMYASITKQFRKEINDLGLFLKRKTVNKIIHKIKPFQLSGEIDEGNIADIFVSKNPRIFKNESYHYSPKNNIIILLDCSGSMFSGYRGNSISKALLLTIQMLEAALLANFDIEVYGFTETNKMFLERKKKNALPFAKKYGFEMFVHENRRGVKFNAITLKGHMIFNILNSKKFKNQQDIFKAKNFLTNLYISSNEDGNAKRQNLFCDLQGNTPEISAMSYLCKYIKYLPTKNTIFMLNDGMYNDRDALSEQIRYLYRDADSRAFMHFVYSPNMFNDLNKFFQEINTDLASDSDFNLFCDALEYLMPQTLINYDDTQDVFKRDYLKQNQNIIKLNTTEICEVLSDFCGELKKKIDNKETSKLNGEIVSALSGCHNFYLERDNILNSEEVYYNIKKYSLNNEPNVKIAGLIYRNKKSQKLILVDLIINGNEKRYNIQISNFCVWFLKYVMNEMCNIFYKHALNVAKEKNDVKIFTIGIGEASGNKYNDDFICVTDAQSAGTVISEKLKQIW